MANLTITVDDDLLRRARVRAAEHGTSVNSILRDELIRFAGAKSGADPVSEFLTFARSRSGSSGPAGREWSREQLHLERFERPNHTDSA
ncbi:MAG: hypothetical protein HZB14_09960 [Actinobacteria bacterium]|nr:hypothetical protein [Actinomycetota bacterium]